MRAIDISRQSTGRALTIDECHKVKEDGNDILIVGLFDGATVNPYARETLENAQQVDGLYTAVYIALAPGYEGRLAVDRLSVLSFPTIDKLNFVSIDCELDNITLEQINSALVRVVGGYKQRPVIYSAYWYWMSRFNNPTVYGASGLKIPLWNAYYDNDPDYDFSKLPFGGWTYELLVGEQYQGTTTYPGSDPAFDVDYSEFKEEWIEAGPGSLNGLQQLAQAWHDDMSDTIKGAAALHNGVPTSIGLATYGQAQEAKAQRWATILGGK